MKKDLSIVIISILLLIVGFLLYLLLMNKEKIETPNNNIVATNEVVNITKTITSDSVIYEVIDNQKKLSYSWTFERTEELDKALKDNMEIDINLNLNILDNLYGNALDEKVTNQDKLIVSFEHHGALPSKATVKLDVSQKYKDGEKLYLYYYNEEKNEIDFIDNGLVVKNGKVEFTIEHCSNYLLTASIVQDAVGNPKNINIIIIIMAVVIIVLIGATLFQNKK